MTADVIVDFDNHFTNGRVYLAQVELEMQDEDNTTSYTVDYYVIANSPKEARFLVNSTYPDAVEINVQSTPVTPEQYASRRD